MVDLCGLSPGLVEQGLKRRAVVQVTWPELVVCQLQGMVLPQSVLEGLWSLQWRLMEELASLPWPQVQLGL